MPAKKKAASKAAPVEQPAILAYKGFDKYLRCRGHQFAVGEGYTHDGPVRICNTGFHVVTADNPLAAFRFYPPKNGARYCEVRYDGATDADTSGCNKLAVEKLTVSAELPLAGFIKAGVSAVIKRAKDKAASGYSSTGAASGNSSTGAASGDYSTGAASGYSSTGAASGDYSTGAASGDYSTGAASGNSSTGAASGDYSTAIVSGPNSIAVATGGNAKARACSGSGFVLGEFDDVGKLIRLHAAMVGEDGIKPDTLYTVRGGKLVEAA